MSLNRTLQDFVVKKAKIEVRVGNKWEKPLRPPEVGKKYRLSVTCGNANGMINWGTERDYNKVQLQIRVVPMGFKSGSSFKGYQKVEFYTNSSFSQVIPANPPSKTYRTDFTLPEYKPTHADTVTYLYLKFKPNVPNISFSKLRWTFGIYGAVRNHHWKQRYTV